MQPESKLKDMTMKAYNRMFNEDKFTGLFKGHIKFIDGKSGYRYIEQNHMKAGSKHAEDARSGTKIMWVIDKKKETYIAKVTDGVFEKL